MRHVRCSFDCIGKICYVFLILCFAMSMQTLNAKTHKHHAKRHKKEVLEVSERKVGKKQEVAKVSNVAKVGAAFTALQAVEIQKIVHDYLVKNPKILIEMSQALEKVREKEVVKMQSETKGLIGNHIKDLLNVKDRVAIGNLKGDVVLVEFFDYQCGHCKPMGAIMDKLVKQDPNLEVVFVEWPIFGNDSVFAAKAVFSARKQNKYFELHNAMLAETGAITKDKILQMAKSIGLDEKKLQKDINTKFIDNIVKSNFQLAQELKLIATPAFIFINRKNNKHEFLLGQVGEKELLQAISNVRAKGR